jgi:hypothetical protein
MKAKYLIFLTSIILFSTFVAMSQENKAVFPIEPKTQSLPASCEIVLRDLDILIQRINSNDLLIIISHEGKMENKWNLAKRRLHNAKTYYTDGITIFKRLPESIITAEGDKTDGKGYLDFFVKGQLELRIYLHKNRDLAISTCVLLPEEKPCSTSFEKLVYPCKRN